MITVEAALRIALKAHTGQKDLDGYPEILHPLAVGIAGDNEEEVITGFLHDVVEDSTLTFDDLLREGVDENIIEALKLLTHDKNKKSYMNFNVGKRRQTDINNSLIIN